MTQLRQRLTYANVMSTVAFFKDQEGIVHLKGLASGPAGTTIFKLPAGYRPAGDTYVTTSIGSLRIYGSNTADAGLEGAVVGTGKLVGLDGFSFRAES